MKRILFINIVLVVGSVLNLYSQSIIVESGGFYVDQSTNVILYNTDINSKGEFEFKENSEIAIKSSSRPIELHGDLLFHDVFVDANVLLYSDVKVNGDIYLNSGILDLLDSNIKLKGVLKNESNESRVFSSGVGSIGVISDIAKGININPGNLGLSIVSTENYNNIEFIRGHDYLVHESDKSILRHFKFNVPINLLQLRFVYFNAENNSSDVDKLKLATKTDENWIYQKVLSNLSNEILTEGSDKIGAVTLFPKDINVDIEFPTGFSPNDDGVNDYFIINNISKYPNNKLIIFNRWGDVVFEKASYSNDWNGEVNVGLSLTGDKKLVEGTYFYFFYYDKDNRNELKKGFFEIKKQ